MSSTTTPTAAASAANGPLPTPDQRPDADVVIYDGDCRICTAQVRKLPWWDCQKRLAYLSLHDPEVARRYPDLTHEALMRDMYIVDRQGGRHRGAAAVRYLSRRLRRLWWLAPVLHIPGSLPLWQWLYRQIANRRYRFGRTNGRTGVQADDCDGGTCHLHQH